MKIFLYSFLEYFSYFKIFTNCEINVALVLFGLPLSKFPKVAITNYNKFTGLNNRIYSLTVLEPEVCNWGVGRATLLLKALQENPSLPFPVSGGPWHSLSWVSRTSASASVFTWPSSLCLCLSSPYLFLIRHLSLDFGPTLIQDDLISWSLIAFAKTLIINKVILSY